MAIVFAFMIPVDGWLTKLSAPIVVYRPTPTPAGSGRSGTSWPRSIAYAFALLTLVILCWERSGRRAADAEA